MVSDMRNTFTYTPLNEFPISHFSDEIPFVFPQREQGIYPIRNVRGKANLDKISDQLDGDCYCHALHVLLNSFYDDKVPHNDHTFSARLIIHCARADAQSQLTFTNENTRATARVEYVGSGYSIVYGVNSKYHSPHITHLAENKSNGDRLVVVVGLSCHNGLPTMSGEKVKEIFKTAIELLG